MNQNEALLEARRRWGMGAAISVSMHQSVLDPYERRVCGVGLLYEIKGSGPTWEDAFLDSSQRAGEPSE